MFIRSLTDDDKYTYIRIYLYIYLYFFLIRVVYLELFQDFQWKQVGALTEDNNKYSEYISVLMDNLPEEMNVESVKLKQGDVIKEVSYAIVYYSIVKVHCNIFFISVRTFCLI